MISIKCPKLECDFKTESLSEQESSLQILNHMEKIHSQFIPLSASDLELFQTKEIEVKKRRMSKSNRAGLHLPVARIHRLLREESQSKKIGNSASIFMTSVLEYLTHEVLELAAEAATQFKVKRITPRHLLLVIRNDAELNQLLSKVTIPQGGVIPNIQAQGYCDPKKFGCFAKLQQKYFESV
jgi:histone H2A